MKAQRKSQPRCQRMESLWTNHVVSSGISRWRRRTIKSNLRWPWGGGGDYVFTRRPYPYVSQLNEIYDKHYSISLAKVVLSLAKENDQSYCCSPTTFKFHFPTRQHSNFFSEILHMFPSLCSAARYGPYCITLQGTSAISRTNTSMDSLNSL